ncbi:MAG: stage III sporulation protein AF [Clostridiales bacterium]|jgi:stage III sporulation protein AF|nr:stage III sporulation protein AF [Clostridiales bacterium]
MLNMLSEVVRNIVVLIIMATILELVLPRSDFRPFINMVVGLVLMLMLLSPLRTVLQMPGSFEPVFDFETTVPQADVDRRYMILEQMNWDMTLERYRSLMKERIAAVLMEKGLVLIDVQLDLEEEVNHLEFGRPRFVSVLAAHGGDADGGVRPVEKIRIIIGEGDGGGTDETESNPALARDVAAALGINEQKVDVKVLKE